MGDLLVLLPFAVGFEFGGFLGVATLVVWVVSGFVSVGDWFWLVMVVRFSSSAVFWFCVVVCLWVWWITLVATCIGRLFFDCLVVGDLLVWVS